MHSPFDHFTMGILPSFFENFYIHSAGAAASGFLAGNAIDSLSSGRGNLCRKVTLVATAIILGTVTIATQPEKLPMLTGIFLTSMISGAFVSHNLSTRATIRNTPPNEVIEPEPFDLSDPMPQIPARVSRPYGLTTGSVASESPYGDLDQEDLLRRSDRNEPDTGSAGFNFRVRAGTRPVSHEEAVPLLNTLSGTYRDDGTFEDEHGNVHQMSPEGVERKRRLDDTVRRLFPGFADEGDPIGSLTFVNRGNT